LFHQACIRSNGDVWRLGAVRAHAPEPGRVRPNIPRIAYAV